MSGGKPDITSRADIEAFVDAFYARVRRDDILGPIFDDVAQTDWTEHLPKMYDFWHTVLFGVSAFRGNPLGVHLALNTQVSLGPAAFARWLALFHATIDASFSGPCAEETKIRAARIAGVMQHHIALHDASPQWA
jgi:hemoglobin